jgi:Uma2 family endonuclease
MVTHFEIPEQRVLLQNITWDFFEQLLTELGLKRSVRLAYHRGTLEIMNPSWEHEHYNRLIEALIITLVEELNLNIWLGGSVMLKRVHMKAGKEPASCYYLKNEPKIRRKKNLDLQIDPSPDLALEIDLVGSALNQLILYADLDIPEIWRYNGSQLYFYQLNHGAYVMANNSPTFPFLSGARVQEYLEQCQTDGFIVALNELRQWVKSLEK